MNRFKPYLILVAFFAVSSGCKKESKCYDATNPDCENYDPCFGIEAPTAFFFMEECTFNENNDRECYADTVFRGASLQFRSDYMTSEYTHTWYVGTEVFNGSATPIRKFNDVPRPNVITIMHVIEYPIDQNCYPNASGKDSVAQQFYLINRWDELLTHGTFRGVLEGEVDSFDIKILPIDAQGNPAFYGDYEDHLFINFFNNGDTINDGFIPYNPLNAVAFLRGNGSSRPKGRLAVNPETYEVNLYYVLNAAPFSFSFKGRKLD